MGLHFSSLQIILEEGQIVSPYPPVCVLDIYVIVNLESGPSNRIFSFVQSHFLFLWAFEFSVRSKLFMSEWISIKIQKMIQSKVEAKTDFFSRILRIIVLFLSRG